MTLKKLSLLAILLTLALSLTAFAGPAAAQAPDNSIPWWAWLLIVLALLIFAAVLIMWWLGGPGEEEEHVAPTALVEEPAPRAPAVATELQEVEAEAPAVDVELPEVEVEEPPVDVARPETEVRAPAVELDLPETEPAVAKQPDDLKIIEGIGPKISQVLGAAGIETFAELAATSPERIEEILAAESSRLASLADATTWPAQAELAAEGKWDELQALQDSLVGGRVGGPSPT